MQKSFTIKMVQQRRILGKILLSLILLMLTLDEINISMILLGVWVGSWSGRWTGRRRMFLWLEILFRKVHLQAQEYY